MGALGFVTGLSLLYPIRNTSRQLVDYQVIPLQLLILSSMIQRLALQVTTAWIVNYTGGFLLQWIVCQETDHFLKKVMKRM